MMGTTRRVTLGWVEMDVVASSWACPPCGLVLDAPGQRPRCLGDSSPGGHTQSNVICFTSAADSYSILPSLTPAARGPGSWRQVGFGCSALRPRAPRLQGLTLWTAFCTSGAWTGRSWPCHPCGVPQTQAGDHVGLSPHFFPGVVWPLLPYTHTHTHRGGFDHMTRGAPGLASMGSSRGPVAGSIFALRSGSPRPGQCSAQSPAEPSTPPGSPPGRRLGLFDSINILRGDKRVPHCISSEVQIRLAPGLLSKSQGLGRF